MIVGIFGTWRACDGDRIYTRALQCGQVLAAAGKTVLTGGYSGVMEAASRGAVEAGGKAIGVTCPEIDKLMPANPWVTTRIPAKDLQDRLAIAFRMVEAAIFFPGRAGTMAELSLALELREKGTLRYPILLSCNFWDGFLQACDATANELPYPSTCSNDLYTHYSGSVEIVNILGGGTK